MKGKVYFSFTFFADRCIYTGHHILFTSAFSSACESSACFPAGYVSIGVDDLPKASNLLKVVHFME